MFLFIIICSSVKYLVKIIQIHPMFLFILSNYENGIRIPRFKYIPCFYLSKRNQKAERSGEIFKYIPCFYLSNVFTSFFIFNIPQNPLFFNILWIFYQANCIIYHVMKNPYFIRFSGIFPRFAW